MIEMGIRCLAASVVVVKRPSSARGMHAGMRVARRAQRTRKLVGMAPADVFRPLHVCAEVVSQELNFLFLMYLQTTPPLLT